MIGAGLLLIYLTFGQLVGIFERQIILVSALALLAFGIGLDLFRYLQPPRKDLSKNRSSFNRAAINRLRSDVNSILKQQNEIGQALTDQEKKALINKVHELISHDIVSQIAEQWNSKLRNSELANSHLDRIRRLADAMQDRLQEEIAALGRRANLNLVIGILVSVLGLLALTWFVVTATSELMTGISVADAAIKFSIRLTLAVFLQLFAYFFLRLYRHSIFEIKYFQNEITGAQFRLIAVESAMRISSNKVIEKVCLELSKTERNFVLKKGETTVALKHEEIEKEYENKITGIVERTLRSQKTHST